MLTSIASRPSSAQKWPQRWYLVQLSDANSDAAPGAATDAATAAATDAVCAAVSAVAAVSALKKFWLPSCVGGGMLPRFQIRLQIQCQFQLQLQFWPGFRHGRGSRFSFSVACERQPPAPRAATVAGSPFQLSNVRCSRVGPAPQLLPPTKRVDADGTFGHFILDF